MTQNPFGQSHKQTHENMHTGSVPQQMNHGGHELFDVHEALSGTVAGSKPSNAITSTCARSRVT